MTEISFDCNQRHINKILEDIEDAFDIGMLTFVKDVCPITLDMFREMFQGGSISYTDGLILYGLAKSLKPKEIIELGTFIGTSTVFLIAGAKEGGTESIVTVDRSNELIEQLHGKAWGENINSISYEPVVVSKVQMLCTDFLATMQDASLEFIFEDTDHTYETTAAVVELAKEKLVPSGFIIFHDALMTPMQEAFTATGIGEEVLVFPGTACGLGIWRNTK